MPYSPGQETQEQGWGEAMVDPPSYFFGRLTTSWRWITMCEEEPPGSKNWVKYEYEEELFQRAQEAGYGSGIFNAKVATFILTPLNPTLRPWKREFSLSNNKKKEWRTVIRPSIVAVTDQVAAIKGLVMGQFITTIELSDMFVSGERKLNPDNRDKDDTFKTMKFEKVYVDEAACRTAWEAYLTKEGKDIPGAPAAPVVPMAPIIDPAERAGLVAFLDHFWKESKGDPLPLTTFNDYLNEESVLRGAFALADAECVALHGYAANEVDDALKIEIPI